MVHFIRRLKSIHPDLLISQPTYGYPQVNQTYRGLEHFFWPNLSGSSRRRCDQCKLEPRRQQQRSGWHHWPDGLRRRSVSALCQELRSWFISVARVPNLSKILTWTFYCLYTYLLSRLMCQRIKFFLEPKDPPVPDIFWSWPESLWNKICWESWSGIARSRTASSMQLIGIVLDAKTAWLVL